MLNKVQEQSFTNLIQIKWWGSPFKMIPHWRNHFHFDKMKRNRSKSAIKKCHCENGEWNRVQCSMMMIMLTFWKMKKIPSFSWKKFFFSFRTNYDLSLEMLCSKIILKWISSVVHIMMFSWWPDPKWSQ